MSVLVQKGMNNEVHEEERTLVFRNAPAITIQPNITDKKGPFRSVDELEARLKKINMATKF